MDERLTVVCLINSAMEAAGQELPRELVYLKVETARWCAPSVRERTTDETKTMFGFPSGFVRGFVTVFGLFVLLLVALAVLGALAS